MGMGNAYIDFLFAHSRLRRLRWWREKTSRTHPSRPSATLPHPDWGLRANKKLRGRFATRLWGEGTHMARKKKVIVLSLVGTTTNTATSTGVFPLNKHSHSDRPWQANQFSMHLSQNRYLSFLRDIFSFLCFYVRKRKVDISCLFMPNRLKNFEILVQNISQIGIFWIKKMKFFDKKVYGLYVRLILSEQRERWEKKWFELTPKTSFYILWVT